jgi:hypothetical protein
MMYAFRLVALPVEAVAHLFDRSDAELAAHGAQRCIVDTKPGFPCRVSLVDAELGEHVILLPFTHHDTPSPYRGVGPIFVREHARTAHLAVNEVPAMIRRRLLSIRAYDRSGILIGAEVAEGSGLEAQIERFFRDAAVESLHLHNARPGCFNCRVERA